MTDSVGVGLHIILPPALVPNAGTGAGDLVRLLDAVPATSIEVVSPDQESDGVFDLRSWMDRLDKFRTTVQGRGIALVARIDGANTALVAAYHDQKLDGVMVDKPTDIPKVRGVLGSTDIIGCRVGSTSRSQAGIRHDAMVAGEAGADVIVFPVDWSDTDPDRTSFSTVQWWAEMMEIPCIAQIPPTLEAAALAREAGAEFIGVDERLWADAPDITTVVDRLRGLYSAVNPSR